MIVKMKHGGITKSKCAGLGDAAAGSLNPALYTISLLWNSKECSYTGI